MVKRTILFIGMFNLLVNAAVPAEVSAMDSTLSGSGTRLVSMPTYIYGRSQGQLGFQAEDELWSPDRSGSRHIPNRYTPILNWNVGAPELWFSTGNEVGDLLYQELLDDSHGSNRTPMLDGGLVTPTWNHFYATAQGSQVDHYSSETLGERTRRNGSMSFAWFGENLPAFSTAFAGAGYRTAHAQAELLAGSDYLWVQSSTRRWVPLQIKPRVQASAMYGRAALNLAYERQEFNDQVFPFQASKDVVSGSLRMACPRECQMSGIVLGGGMAFRHEQDSGAVPFALQNRSTVFWPWLEWSVRLAPQVRWAAYAGLNDQDRMFRDSLEFTGHSRALQYRTGWQNAWNNTLDPLGYDIEVYRGDTLPINPPTGYHHSHKLFAELRYIRTEFSLQSMVWGLADRGATIFQQTDSLYDNQQWFRIGEPQRIQAWLGSLGASLGGTWRYQEWFESHAEGGYEHILGPSHRLETTPVHTFAKFSMSGLLLNKIRIQHEWIYRSEATWNHEIGGPLTIDPGWTWNATLSQSFPEYRMSLHATWLHVLASNEIQAPYGGRDRTRFYCTLRKEF